MKKMPSTFLALFAATLLFSVSAYGIDLQQNPEVENYIQSVSHTYHFNPAQLEKWFGKVQFSKTPTPPPTTKPAKASTGVSIGMPWYIYRDRVLSPKRIKNGVQFWQQNGAILAATENQYGVPATLIVGILGLETSYGKDEGDYSALAALSTYAFRMPRRQDYFRDELTSYLLLCREQKWDPLRICSSVDGGLGMAQFMPSSYRSYAIDADHKGKKNLFKNTHDAVASIGNYLKRKGWQKDQPVAMPAQIVGNNYQKLMAENAKLHFTIKELRDYGLAPAEPMPDDTPVGVAFLKFEDHISPWLFFHNFSVIKSYNNSTNYALSVYNLGNVIQEQAAGLPPVQASPATPSTQTVAPPTKKLSKKHTSGKTTHHKEKKKVTSHTKAKQSQSVSP